MENKRPKPVHASIEPVTIESVGLSARDAAAALGVCERTVRRAIARGDLPAKKFGSSFRIQRADLHRFSASRRTHDTGPRELRGDSSRLVLLPSIDVDPVDPPEHLSSFVGRSSDIAAIEKILSTPGSVLLTLTGPGGAGKTRLAIHAVSRLRGAFPDGTAFADLSLVTNPDLVLASIARALGLSRTDDQHIAARLAAILRNRRMLLVLDNFEQVIEAAPFVAELTTRSKDLKVLVTSRSRLRIRGEREHIVAPLSVPAARADITLEHVLETDAGRLFHDRASAHNPSLHEERDLPATIAEVCNRLDGLPLALELAAARTSVLSARELADRLHVVLPMLSDGPRDAPGRHRTMRDAIAWSYNLLAPDLQWLFRSLAIFRGGFSLETAQAVTGADVLDGVTKLAELSLLSRAPGEGGGTRFSMLETVREFGLELLSIEGEFDEIALAHAEAFRRLLEPLHSPLHVMEDHLRFEAWTVEHANFDAALETYERLGHIDSFAGFLFVLTTHWMAVGSHRAARQWLERLSSHSDKLSEWTRARTWYEAARFATIQRDNDAAEAHFQRAIPILRHYPDRLETGHALTWYGSLLGSLGNYDEGERLLFEALAIAKNAPPSIQAHIFYGDVLSNLGVCARGRGDLLIATERHEEARSHYRAHGFDYGELRCELDLADVTRDRGNFRLAASRYRDLLMQFSERLDKRAIADALEGLALSITGEKTAAIAARLCGLAEELRLNAGIGFRWPADEVALRRCTAMIRSHLDQDEMERAWREGRESSISAMLAVIAELDVPRAAAATLQHSRPNTGLTRRELDVLRFLVERRTDREIAEHLFLSPRTVGWHVTSILSKLGADSRRQAARIAIELGIVY